MLSVKKIISYIVVFVLVLLPGSLLLAQENSPYSRYGIGDLYPNQTIATRGLAGLTAAYSDGRTLNADNPASYGDIKSFVNGGLFTFDIGVSIDARALHSASPVLKYNSVNFIPSYVLVGFPLNKHHWGVAAGLKPVSRINYSITSATRGIADSMQTLNEGTGGLNQAFVGIGKRWGGFSLGVNGGYLFGRKEISTNAILINDSVGYHNGRVASTGNFGGLFANAGVQLNINLGKHRDSISKIESSYGLTLGASGTLKQNVNVYSNVLNETYYYSTDGAVLPYDTIKYVTNPVGKAVLPMTMNVGFMFTKQLTSYVYSDNKWMIGGEFSMGNWGSDYRYLNQTDQVVNNYMVRVGGAITPDPFATGFFSHTTYRLGFLTGKDYVDADGNGLKTTAVTFGAGFKVKSPRFSYQSTVINTAIEVGKRGTNVNNVTENFFKISAGLSLSDIWFTKRKYE